MQASTTTSTFKYKVKTPLNWSYAQVAESIKNGARFVIYPYTFAFGLSVVFYSKAHLIEPEKSEVVKGLPFLLFSLLLGWLNIPYGPYRVIICIRDILKGGIDVTEDIIENISEEEFNSSRVLNVFEITGTKATQLFKRMDKSDEKACIKVCQKIALEFPEITEFAFGFFINTQDFDPYRCLGIGGNFNSEIDKERIIELLHTKFYERVNFEIIDMRNNEELSSPLKTQGRFVNRADIMAN